MSNPERFDQNARSKGILLDTNLLALLIVGFVNRDRVDTIRFAPSLPKLLAN